MKLEDTRIAMLVGPGFEDLEFWAVYMRMEEEGADIDVVGMEAGVEYTGKSGGLTAETEVAAKEVDTGAFDAVLVPGGWTPDKIRRDQSVLDLVRDVYEDGNIVGLICHAGLVGISAGIVEGSDATGSLGIKDDLINAGANWVDEPAFRDGNIVWGRVVADIPDYNRVLVNTLAEHSA
ncbi:type 1 glutamine amidotransferase [Haloarcula sp. S1CR25-12]|jgi:protease I|uniref:Type 1 glutamine amidotransferase n=1 Tax=Haloarcula saliterrae TaxID=2950534 RepID=A0ABU2FHG6_9EURY|nr:type 1 glutamine amidotransferase domain-containing protein [Haloarcula sp. S1CR25-12]MDS0261703.1 type 1 glutamine amidotransferase [Haloarcula sp. S1CR25-12]